MEIISQIAFWQIPALENSAALSRQRYGVRRPGATPREASTGTIVRLETAEREYLRPFRPNHNRCLPKPKVLSRLARGSLFNAGRFGGRKTETRKRHRKLAKLPHSVVESKLLSQFPGSSTVEHSAVNRRVASSNLARGAKLFNQLGSCRNCGF
jgi:hypothetical protein